MKIRNSIYTSILLLCLLMSISLIHAQQTRLEVGGQAEVYVEDPTGLRLRSNPGTNNSVVADLFTGDIVNIIGGPQNASGYVWWNVRTASGQVGWTIEGVGSLQTLIPLAAPLFDAVSVLTIPLETDNVYNLAWNPDDTLLAIASPFGQMWIYEMADGTLIQAVDTPSPESIRWSADGSLIEVSDLFGELTNDFPTTTQVFDAVTGEIVAEDNLSDDVVWIEQPEARSGYSCFSSGSNADKLFIQQSAGLLRAGYNPAEFTAASGQRFTLGNGTGGAVWLPGSELIVIWSFAQTAYNEAGGISSGTAEVWNIQSGDLIARVAHGSANYGTCGNSSYRAVLSYDETRIAAIISAMPMGTLTIWQIQDDSTAVDENTDTDNASSEQAEDSVTCTATVPQNANIRGGAGTNFERVGVANGGSTVIFDAQNTAGGFVWYRLEIGGWLREDVVSVTPECTDLANITP